MSDSKTPPASGYRRDHTGGYLRTERDSEIEHRLSPDRRNAIRLDAKRDADEVRAAFADLTDRYQVPDEDVAAIKRLITITDWAGARDAIKLAFTRAQARKLERQNQVAGGNSGPAFPVGVAQAELKGKVDALTDEERARQTMLEEYSNAYRRHVVETVDFRDGSATEAEAWAHCNHNVPLPTRRK